MAEEVLTGKPRTSWWKIAAGILGSLILLLLFGWATASCNAKAALRRLAEDQPRRIAEIRARESRRPVLRGEPVAGSAWACYAEALRKIEPLTARTKDLDVLESFLDGKAEVLDRTRELVAEFDSAFADLELGAARSNGMIPIDWERGFHAKVPGVRTALPLARLAACRARLLVEEGRHRQALDLLTDLMTFGRDQAYNSTGLPFAYGIAILRIALQQLGDLVRLDGLPASDLQEMARRLDIVDRSWPSLREILLNEVAGLHGACLTADVELELPLPFRDILLANGLSRIEAQHRRAAEVCDGPWPDAQALARAQESETRSAEWNPVLRYLYSPLARIAEPSRATRAQLRLIRAVVGWRISGDVPKLEDPFGGEIRSAPPRFWSRGKDGVDDGGKGDWKGSPDIVLEVPAP